MMKINLIAINPEPYSLGLAYLHAALKKNTKCKNELIIKQLIFEWEVVAAPYYDYTFLISKILSNNPDVIGFSAYLWNINLIQYLTNIIHSLHLNIKLIIGGPEIEGSGKICWEKFPLNTYFVLGEGEEPLCNLIEVFYNNDINIPPNIVKKTENGFISGKKESSPTSVDNIPSPILESTLITNYIDWIPSYVTTRGCTFRCSYCRWQDGKGYRKFPLDRVLKELEILKTKKFHKIWFTDTVFGKNKDRDYHILAQLLDWPNECRFDFETHIEFITPEFVNYLSKVNIDVIAIGVQSFNPLALRNCNRSIDIRQIIHKINLIYYGIPQPQKIHIDLIFGLPGDTIDEAIKSIDIVKKNFPLITIFFEVLKVLPGTKFYETSKKERWTLHNSIGFYDVISQPTFPFESILTMKKIGLGIDFLQYKSCRSWADQLFLRLNLPYSKLAQVAGEILTLNKIDYHHEYNRTFWFDNIFSEKNLLNYLQTKIQSELLKAY